MPSVDRTQNTVEFKTSGTCGTCGTCGTSRLCQSGLCFFSNDVSFLLSCHDFEGQNMYTPELLTIDGLSCPTKLVSQLGVQITRLACSLVGLTLTRNVANYKPTALQVSGAEQPPAPRPTAPPPLPPTAPLAPHLDNFSKMLSNGTPGKYFAQRALSSGM
jgi:hypothetical protein